MDVSKTEKPLLGGFGGLCCGFPGALRRPDNLTGFEVACGNADFFDSPILNDFHRLEIGLKAAGGDAGGL